MVTKFQDLICWQKAMELSVVVYQATHTLKDFELKNQLRRAAISTMNNIAEGFGRKHSKEMSRYMEFTTASCLEIESMTLLMERLKLLNQESIIEIREKAIETYKVTSGFAKKLKMSD
jgi:four helix bundle protein